MTSVSPYLGFDGDCEEAFEFYRSVFGGEFSGVSRYSEMPADSGGRAGGCRQDHAHLAAHRRWPGAHGL